MSPERRRPLIFDIHRYALDDGPGIRTTVFFKGCPLACIWCHNPEGIHAGPELFHHARKCIGCGDCASGCPRGAVILLNSTVQINREYCDACGQCAALCPAKAMTIKGRYYEPEALAQELLIDRRFFHHSGGGVTFSGGEPTRHPLYLGRAVRTLKRQGVHVALQTCGHFQWDLFAAELLPWIDLIYFDIKIIDPQQHRQLTGQSNLNILTNFSKLVHTARAKLICTIPLISGLNTTPENLQAIADVIENLPYRLYPYHPGADAKSAALGKIPALRPAPPAMTGDEHQQITDTFDTFVNNLRNRR